MEASHLPSGERCARFTAGRRAPNSPPPNTRRSRAVLSGRPRAVSHTYSVSVQRHRTRAESSAAGPGRPLPSVNSIDRPLSVKVKRRNGRFTAVIGFPMAVVSAAPRRS